MDSTAQLQPSPSLQVSTPSVSASASPVPAQSGITPPSTNGFQFPAHYSFPPFFTLQPNITTRSRQLALWSSFIQSYCAHNHIFRVSLSAATNTPLFQNATINRRLDLLSIRQVLDYMVSGEGDRRAEWVGAGKGQKVSANDSKSTVWIYWKRPEEWADAIHGWVDGTGQKGSVLTIYELRESDAVQSQQWIGMDEDMFRRCLDVLVKKGKAQIFGADESAGVKFY